MTIYEIDGKRYGGPLKIEIKPHPRFLGFVRLCIDDQEYAVASDDLMRAIDGVLTRLPPPPDELPRTAADLLNQFVEERAAANPPRNIKLLPD